MAKRERRSLPISDLMINSENPRFDPVTNQKEAIRIMLENEGKGIKKLAQDITINGLNPLESFAVVPKQGKYLTLEGNRRIIILKLLNDPSKIEDQNLHEFFVKMMEKASAKIPNTLLCTIFENDDDAHHWIKLKHTGQNKGAGTVSWTPIQQDRFLKKASKRIQVFEFVKKNKIDSKDVEVTNLERLISTSYVCTKIGISFQKGELRIDKPKSEVKTNLKKVFERISKKEFKVGDIYTSDQRKTWISDVLKSPTSKITANKTTATSKDSVAGASDDTNTSQDTHKNSSKSTNRKHLIPEDFSLTIPQGKINDVYLELKDDLIIDASNKSTPNAVGVLFRVFLEISLDHYIDRKKIDVSKKLAKKVKSNYKKDLTINEKIRFVANYMEENNIANAYQLTQIRRVADSSNNMLNINSFHEFVHSPTIFPEDLKSKWSNLQSFFELLWNGLNKKEN